MYLAFTHFFSFQIIKVSLHSFKFLLIWQFSKAETKTLQLTCQHHKLRHQHYNQRGMQELSSSGLGQNNHKSR